MRPFLFLERRWRAGTGRPDNGCRLRVAASLGLSAGAQALADAIVKLQYSPLHLGVRHAGALAEHPDRLMGLLNVSPEFGCADGEEQFLRIAFFHYAVVIKVRECFEQDKGIVEVAKERRERPRSAHGAEKCPDLGNDHGQPRFVLVAAKYNLHHVAALPERLRRHFLRIELLEQIGTIATVNVAILVEDDFDLGMGICHDDLASHPA